MKKTILFILCIVLAAFTLSGCGSNIHDADSVMIYRFGPTRLCSITVTNPEKIAELADFFEKLEDTEMPQDNEMEMLWGVGTNYIYFMRDGKPIGNYENFGGSIAFNTAVDVSPREADIPFYTLTSDDYKTLSEYIDQATQTGQVEDFKTYDDIAKKCREVQELS